MIRVLHLEHDGDYHRFLAAALGRVRGGLRIDMVPDFEEAVGKLTRGEYDCLLTNDQLEGGSGIKLIAAARSRGSMIPAVVLTDEAPADEVEYVERAYFPDGYNVKINFEKFETICHWIRALVQAHREQQQVSSTETDREQPDEGGVGALKEALGGLTGREREILGLLARGLSNKEIAAELGISYYTVINHVQNLYGKLGIHSRAEAIHLTLKLGVLKEL